MENIKNDSIVKICSFSIIGIIIFFIPIKINNEYETILYHISYFIENKITYLIDISVVFFITLSIFRDILWKKENNKSFRIIVKIFSLIILIMILIGNVRLLLMSDSFILILQDLIRDLTILLPISSLFMPFILDYGLLEVTESYTQKIMKKMFKVSGKVFLNFLVYLLVNNVCGAFITYKLYKDGKLREKEAVITILNFSILSLTLTGDLCDKINISTIKFFVIEILILIICNFIICRIYPLKNKKNSYYFKSGYKNVNCKKNKINTAIKKYNENKKSKNILSLSLYYLNDVISILMDLIPNIVFIFFIFNIIYKIPFFENSLNTIIDACKIPFNVILVLPILD